MDYKRKYLMATFSNFKSTLVAAADTAAGASAAATTVVADINALIALTGMSDGDQAFVTSNNNLYFYSGGWYKIATLANDSPSSITGVNGSYALALDGTATTITAVSTDPEGFPLTWSYSTLGLGNIATISQADNVFTITPSTNTANAGSFTLTLNVTDGVNGAVSTSSTIELTFKIVNSKYTTALITAVDTSDNNNITDASSSNHTVTANGNATAGTFGPYRHGGYSTYFDGSGDYYTIPNGLDLGTSDFTFEFWIWPDEDMTGVAKTFINTEYSGGGLGWSFTTATYAGYNGLTFGYGLYGSYTTGRYVDNYWPPRNEWTHLVAQRRNSTIEIYVNGVSQTLTTFNQNATFSDSTNFTSSMNLRTFFSGVKAYVSDLRLVSGSFVYDGNFTPSTDNITAVTDTILLTNQQQFPYFVDNSPNAYEITTYGNTTIKPVGKYDYSPYSASNDGGSVYFDGTGTSYLEASLGNDGVFTGDFTFECWFNTATTTKSYQAILYQSGGSSAPGIWGIDLGTGEKFRFFYGTSVSNYANNASGVTISPNKWYHAAVVRSGTTVTMYLNGTSVSTFTNSETSGSSSWGTTVGRNKYSSSRDFQGYIADVRLTNGTAVYTANFTPPTSPLSSSGAIFHVKGTGASIIDKAQSTNLVLPNSGVTGSTTQVKFASTKSMYFDGTSSAGVPIGTNLFLDTLNTEYTLEMWYYPTQTGTNSFLMTSYISSSTGRWMLYQQGTDSRIRFFGNLNGTREVFTAAVSANNWYHVAVVRKSNGYISIFLNGAETELAVDLNGYATVLDRPVLLGSGDTFSTSGCQGYIQDVRITRGLARYTSNFTPPTSELQG